MPDNERTAIRFGGYQPEDSVHSRAMIVFRDELHRRLGDAVSCEITGNIMDSGHMAADLLRLVESGAFSLCYFSSSYLADRVPEFALLDLPFVVTDRQQGYAVLDGPLGTLLTERLQSSTSYRLLGFWDNGFRHISNRVRPLRSPSDCAGLTIRTLLSDLHQQTFRSFGFRPIPLDVRELREAVDRGTIDSQDNSLTNIVNFGIHEHHRFVTLSGHFFAVALVLCHGPTFDSWPEDVRTAVIAGVHMATTAQRRFASEEDGLACGRLEAAGVDIVGPNEMNRTAFRTSVEPILQAQRARFGEELMANLL